MAMGGKRKKKLGNGRYYEHKYREVRVALRQLGPVRVDLPNRVLVRSTMQFGPGTVYEYEYRKQMTRRKTWQSLNPVRTLLSSPPRKASLRSVFSVHRPHPCGHAFVPRTRTRYTVLDITGCGVLVSGIPNCWLRNRWLAFPDEVPWLCVQR